MLIERRRSPRIEILDRLQGHIVARDAPVTVRNIGLGGMSIEAPAPFAAGSAHEFSLTIGDGSAVLLRGRVLYSRETSRPDGSPVYVTGIVFIDDELSEVEPGVGDLIDKIK
jgi:hypothetical protein